MDQNFRRKHNTTKRKVESKVRKNMHRPEDKPNLRLLAFCCWFVHAPRKRTQRIQVVQNYLLGPNHWQIAVKRLSKLGLNLDHALPAGNAKRMLMVSYREKLSW